MEPKEQAARLPEKRGVYMFEDAVGQVIYVGKVRPLRNRDKNRKTPGDFRAESFSYSSRRKS
jgi:excinuclease UvrABC nuclease subunit